MENRVHHKLFQRLAQRWHPNNIARTLRWRNRPHQHRQWGQAMHTSSIAEYPVTEETLRASVEAYQDAYKQWRSGTNQLTQAQARLQLQQAQEQLWPQIVSAMIEVARGWVSSNVGRDLSPASSHGSAAYRNDIAESFAMSLYLYIIEALPRLRIDPEQNLRACLKQIAQRRLIDDERRQKRQLSSYFTRAATEPITGTRESAMWFEQIRDTYMGRGAAEPDTLADPASQDAVDAIVLRIDRTEILSMVQGYWRTTLDPDDQFIMQRWNHDPPTTFRELAHQLGPGWSDSMIRQRHHRIMQRTRCYLAEQGLCEP
ncbi:MAG TPA: hypothetical protein PKK78_19705 [Kouleothrix sp.]|nr:hypothetical protein [Kouleothrix sp.]